MKHRITALLLALGLTVSLAACAPKEPQPSESLSPSPDATQTVTPDPDPIPTGDVPTVDPEETELPDKGTPPPEFYCWKGHHMKRKKNIYRKYWLETKRWQFWGWVMTHFPRLYRWCDKHLPLNTLPF